MSEEWDELLDKAALRLAAADRERESRENEEREAAATLTATFDAVAKQYAAVATSFAREVLKHGLPGSENYTFDRRKRPLFGSRFVKIPLVVVSDVGRCWYRASGSTGPVYSHAHALAVGTQIQPTIMAPFKTTEHIGMQLYDDACRSSEPVHGLTRMLDEAKAYGQSPEFLVALLKEGLAAWAARHCPELKLHLSTGGQPSTSPAL